MTKIGGGYRRYKAGKHMPMYSGKEWGELEDIFPRHLKLSSEVYTIITLIAPAWVATRDFIKATYNEKLTWQDFTYLCWMQRVEDAKEDVAFEAFSAMKGLNVTPKLWFLKKSNLTRMGYIENIPLPKQFLYRITGKGKMVVRKFHDEIEQAHKNLAMWQSWKDPDHAKNKITPKLRDFFDIEIPPSDT